MDNKDFIWVEKYRPKVVGDCILPDRIKKNFQDFVDQKSLPNLLLSGTAGTGKTTIARALLEELDYEYMLLNASSMRGIDAVRTTITDFCSTMSLSGQKKAIILDEADGLTAEAQAALRAAYEEFSSVRFILTCNLKNKIIPAIHSRSSVFDFRILAEEQAEVRAQFMKRVVEILQKENVTFDLKALAEIIKRHFPDNRRILNEVQKYATNGSIQYDTVHSGITGSLNDLVKALREKDFAAIRTWVAGNGDIEPGNLFRELYEALYTEVQPDSVPQLVLLIAEYDYRNGFVANPEINTTALLASILGSITFK